MSYQIGIDAAIDRAVKELPGALGDFIRATKNSPEGVPKNTRHTLLVHVDNEPIEVTIGRAYCDPVDTEQFRSEDEGAMSRSSCDPKSEDPMTAIDRQDCATNRLNDAMHDMSSTRDRLFGSEPATSMTEAREPADNVVDRIDVNSNFVAQCAEDIILFCREVNRKL